MERVLAEIDTTVTAYLAELEQQDADHVPETSSIPNHSSLKAAHTKLNTHYTCVYPQNEQYKET